MAVRRSGTGDWRDRFRRHCRHFISIRHGFFLLAEQVELGDS